MLVVITGVIAAIHITDKEADEKALKDLELQWTQAYIQRDAARLEKVFSNDCVITNANGEMLNKEQFLTEARANSTVESIELTDTKVRTYGETAVVNGVGKFTIKNENQNRVDLLRYTNVYIKQQGRWQLIATQNTLLK
jgi:uncharacterized protein (TIGR02246 family)